MTSYNQFVYGFDRSSTCNVANVQCGTMVVLVLCLMIPALVIENKLILILLEFIRTNIVR